MTSRTGSTIMDANVFDTATLGPDGATLLARRHEVLAPMYRLFYDDPVNLVRGRGAHVWDAEGNRYLDMYNNVVSVGHAHPRVVEALATQAAKINTHTRYLHEGIVAYSERLLATMPAEIDRIAFACTGSEANDLALRIAQAHTGHRGVIVTAEAYHGNTGVTAAISPSLGRRVALGPHVRTVPAPDAFRVDEPDLAGWFAAQVVSAADDLDRHGFGVAAFIADSLLSSDGILPGVPGLLGPAVAAVQERGALFIADEVQPGFGRIGTEFWGFARHRLRPDLVTVGKPMGNGMPISAVAARKATLSPFGEDFAYFNTFGGNPVSIAAAAAVLDVIDDEGLPEHNAIVGSLLTDALSTSVGADPAIGEIRSAGLYLGVDIVDDDRRTPDPVRAAAIVNELRHRRVLTSVAGPHRNVLKIRPPFAFDQADIPQFSEAFGASVQATKPS